MNDSTNNEKMANAAGQGVSGSRAACCRVITIGDELLNGVRVDTNTAWLAEQLSMMGIRLEQSTTVGDDPATIAVSIQDAVGSAEIVIVTGGLGPTGDDRTKKAIADLYGMKMTRRPEVEKSVRGFFEERGRETTNVNLDQALVPEGFECRVNPRGTAPGMLMDDGSSLLFILPGVPGEMKALFNEWAGPFINERFGGRRVIVRRRYRTTGIGESDLFDLVGGLEEMAPAVSLSYLPSPEGTTLYLTGSGAHEETIVALLDSAEAHIVRTASQYIYTISDIDLPEYIADLFSREGLTLATAESCTGGLIASRLTDVPGASEWFRRGWVTYSDEAKVEELGVSAESIKEFGAVSSPVVKSMAEGARRRAQTDYAIAVSGIAGPAGERPGKAVGFTCIACAGPEGTVVKEHHLGSSGRMRNKRRSMVLLLDLLRRVVEGIEQ
ncbi:CinA family nicotinamide mononucleotide deamidase-related protein [Candidatus Zixiibacteriota bacterium]